MLFVCVGVGVLCVGVGLLCGCVVCVWACCMCVWACCVCVCVVNVYMKITPVPLHLVVAENPKGEDLSFINS